MPIGEITPNPIFRLHEPSNESWDLIGIIVLISSLVIVFGILGYVVLVDTPTTHAMIEKLSCGELIDYIADKEKFWGYAEHRYEWTCEK